MFWISDILQKSEWKANVANKIKQRVAVSKLKAVA